LIPGGSEIIPKFQQLKEVTQKHGEEAERPVKKAFKEILGRVTWEDGGGAEVGGKGGEVVK